MLEKEKQIYLRKYHRIQSYHNISECLGTRVICCVR